MKHETKQYGAISYTTQNLKEGKDPYPKIIEIHPTAFCNYRCDHRFHGKTTEDVGRKKKKLTLNEYASLFSQMRELDISNLSISGGGEPFMDERTLHILREARKKGLSTRVVTNGCNLNEDLIHELMNSEEIRFSIDAVNPETYSDIKKTSKEQFRIVIGNLEKILLLKQKKKSNLNVGVTFLLNKKNHQEVDEFCKRMLDLRVDAIIIKHNIYNKDGLSASDLDSIKQKISAINNSRIEFRDQEDIRPQGMKCFIPHFKVAFNPYGELYSCCLGSQPKEGSGYSLGNLHNQMLEKIWQESRNLRERLKTKGNVCRNCNYTDHKLNQCLEKEFV